MAGMNEEQARQEIARRVQVTRQDVTVCKKFVLSHFKSSSSEMMGQFLRHLEIAPLEKVVLHESVPLDPQLSRTADCIRWKLAFAEALWNLISAGLIIPISGGFDEIEMHQQWTTVVPGSGGHSSGWRFEEYRFALPHQVRLAPSAACILPQPLSDPDLFLSEFEIHDMQSNIRDALRQAVNCFRHELYLPCVAMLGMASEGAWIELGISLVKAASASMNEPTRKLEKIAEDLRSPYTSALRKMETVRDLYSSKDILSDVIKRSGYNPSQLSQVLIWSNVVRDSRNAIHYGTDPSSDNTYEKVAVLLLAVPINMRILFSIRSAAEDLVNSRCA